MKKAFIESTEENKSLTRSEKIQLIEAISKMLLEEENPTKHLDSVITYPIFTPLHRKKQPPSFNNGLTTKPESNASIRLDAPSAIPSMLISTIMTIVLGYGFGSIWGFVGHFFMADSIAQEIGWATGSPFQTELAFYHLGFGVVEFWRGGFAITCGLRLANRSFYMGRLMCIFATLSCSIIGRPQTLVLKFST